MNDYSFNKLKFLPVEDRKAKCTHYIEYSIQPNHHVVGGIVDEKGIFHNLYVGFHRKEAKRKKLIEFIDKTKIDNGL